MTIERANHVSATDITYLPMAGGWGYLCAIVDWASRKVLSHRVSIGMDSRFCLKALDEAFAKYGLSEIFDTDQGSWFTSKAFTDGLKKRGIKIGMDARGGWCDNVFVERLWRSIKYEELYLHDHDSGSVARAGLARYIDFDNTARPHSSLDKMTPDEVYFATPPASQRAA